MNIRQQEEELMKKKVKDFIARGGKITKLKYHGPKDPKLNMKLKRKKKIKGLNK